LIDWEDDDPFVFSLFVRGLAKRSGDSLLTLALRSAGTLLQFLVAFFVLIPFCIVSE